MATDPTTIPSVVDLQKTKKSMTDIDTFVDSGNDSFTDNNGQIRRTLTGINSDANDLAKNFNLTDAGFDFTTGGTIETYNQLVKDTSGNSWQWQGSLPHTVAAGTVPSSPDYEQRTFNEIANVSGLRDELDALESIIGQSASSVADLASLKANVNNQFAVLISWLPNQSPKGAGIIRFDSTRAKAEHDGGEIFSPTVPFTGNVSDYLGGVGETDPSGSGCWVRVSATGSLKAAFGAAEDGVTDDLAPTAIAYERSSGSDASKVSASIITSSSDVLLKDARISADSFGGFTLDFVAPTITTTTTSSKAFTFTNSVDVNDATGIESGHVVLIKSSVAWPFWTDCFYGHTAVVESVSGNTLTLEQPFMFSIEPGASVTVYGGGTLILDRQSVKNAVSLAGVNSNCVRVLGYGHVEIENAVLENGQSKGLFLAYCVNARVYGGIYKGSNATSTGYGIVAWGCNEVGISGVTGHGNRRLVDFTGDVPTIAGSLRDFKVHGGGKQEDGQAYSPIGGVDNFGAGSHGGAVSMQISDGYIANVSNGINIRSPKSTIKDVHFDGAIVSQIIKLADGADVFIDGVTYRPYASSLTQDTVGTKQSLLPDNFLLADTAFTSKGGKVVVKNTDVHVQDSFFRATGTVTGRVELKQNNCKFDLDGGGTAKWLRGVFNDVVIDGKSVENVSGTRVIVGSASTTLPDGLIGLEEIYKQSIQDNGAASIELNTSAQQVKVEIIDRLNGDVRGIVLVKQGSSLLRDYGSSNLISSASGALNPGDGTASNLTLSLLDGVLYLANKTGGDLTLLLSVQGTE